MPLTTPCSSSNRGEAALGAQVRDDDGAAGGQGIAGLRSFVGLDPRGADEPGLPTDTRAKQHFVAPGQAFEHLAVLDLERARDRRGRLVEHRLKLTLAQR